MPAATPSGASRLPGPGGDGGSARWPLTPGHTFARKYGTWDGLSWRHWLGINRRSHARNTDAMQRSHDLLQTSRAGRDTPGPQLKEPTRSAASAWTTRNGREASAWSSTYLQSLISFKNGGKSSRYQNPEMTEATLPFLLTLPPGFDNTQP